MQPEKKFSVGAISVTVWKNEGKEGEFNTISVERRYKDKEDNWQSTSTFRVGDLPKVRLALDEAYKALVLNEA